MPAKSRGADLATTLAAETTSSGKNKRKRKNPPNGIAADGPPPAKQHRKEAGRDNGVQSPGAVKHALLAQYYPTTLTLRQYVLENLPPSSRLRRKKIAAVGSEHPDEAEDARRVSDPSLRAQLARLLDTTLIGLHAPPRRGYAGVLSEDRLQQWIDYSQRDDSHVTLSGGDASAVHFQSEVGLSKEP